MSRPRFLADNDLRDVIVDGVARHEPAVEFERVRDVGLADKSDPEILEYAAGQGQIVVSSDLNTMSGHAYARVRAGLPMPGLFLAPQNAPIGPVVESLILVWFASEAEEWVGLVRYLPM